MVGALPVSMRDSVDGGHAELLGHFLELERMRFAQTPELGTEPAPTDGRTWGHEKLASSCKQRN